MINIDIKKFNIYTIFSILLLIAGILFYISWGVTYGVWYDIGMYSLTIVLVIPGVVGFILSLMNEGKTN